MKKYRKTQHCFKYRKLKWVLLSFFTIFALFAHTNVFNFLSLWMCLVLVLFLYAEYRLVAQAQGCSADGLVIYKGKKSTEQIDYSEIGCFVIVNATLGEPGDRAGNYGSAPLMGKKVINAKITVRVQYTYLGLYRSLYIAQELYPRFTSYNLTKLSYKRGRFYDKKGKIYGDDRWLYGSICWPDYLEELLTHVQTAPIYILEDVYERFKPDYDRIFSRAKNPIYIVTAPHTCRQYLRKSVI